MQKIEIEEYPLTKVLIKDLEFDIHNPNVMSPEQEEGLKESFRMWGKLDPIKISEADSKGKFKIGDGEHRAKVLRDLGEKEIDAYIIPKINSEVNRKLLRQTFNKLRGQHDLELDIEELQFLRDNEPEQLQKLLSIDDKSIDELRRMFEATIGGNVSGEGNVGEGITEINKTIEVTHTCPKCGYQY